MANYGFGGRQFAPETTRFAPGFSSGDLDSGTPNGDAFDKQMAQASQFSKDYSASKSKSKKNSDGTNKLENSKKTNDQMKMLTDYFNSSYRG